MKDKIKRGVRCHQRLRVIQEYEFAPIGILLFCFFCYSIFQKCVQLYDILEFEKQPPHKEQLVVV